MMKRKILKEKKKWKEKNERKNWRKKKSKEKRERKSVLNKNKKEGI